MAHTTRWIRKNVQGVRREEYHYIIMDGTSTTIRSGIRKIDHVEQWPNGNADNAVNVYKNSASASVLEDDPGYVFFENATDTNHHVLRIVGK